MSPTGKSRRGFTLIEAIVIVVIIGVVSAMAVPRLSGSLSNASLRGAARDLQTAAQYTRDFAISHQTHTRLRIDTEGNLYTLEARQTGDDGRPAFAQLTLAMMGTRSLGRGVEFGRVQIQPGVVGMGSEGAAREGVVSEVHFDPHGQADAAVIELTNGRHAWFLYIAPSTGRVTLSEGSAIEPPRDREDLDV